MPESLQNLKRRIGGIKNVNQITRAMELVAATKMRKSQELALASRPYSFAALELLANLSSADGIKLPPIFEHRTAQRTAYVVITSDKGLAGAFNANVLKAFDKFLAAESASLSPTTSHLSPSPTYIAVGQKAATFLEKKGTLRAKYTRVGDFTTVEQVQPIAELLIDGFLRGEWDRVVVFSAHFRSALLQEVITQEIFPIDVDSLRAIAEDTIPKTGKYAELRANGEFSILSPITPARPNDISRSGRSHLPPDYIIEPSAEAILDNLARHLIVMQIYHLILEANASEHAARRAAMKSASDNAKDLADGLNLLYNKSRQASITREIIEITAGAEALN